MISIGRAAFARKDNEAVMARMTRDRVLFWSVVLSIACPAIFILVWSGPPELWIVGTALVLGFWAMSASFALALLVGFALGRRWLWCLAALPLPLTALLAFLNIGLTWRAGQVAGDYIHFLAKYPHYRSEISALPSGEPRLLVDNWGGVFIVSHGLVYDESDEIAKPDAERTEAWKKRASRTEAECVYGSTPIGGHFYFVGLHC
jgi:hypothetical protein